MDLDIVDVAITERSEEVPPIRRMTAGWAYRPRFGGILRPPKGSDDR